MKDYLINVFFSDQDNRYVADIPDLKYCSALAGTPLDAVREVLKAKKAWLKTAEKEGKPIPKPPNAKLGSFTQEIQMALSVRQPYAELILRGEKKFEYRSGPTDKYRNKQRVLIYASKIPESDARLWTRVKPKPGGLPIGVLVGSVEIVGCEECDGKAKHSRRPGLRSGQIDILKALAKKGSQTRAELAKAATNGHMGRAFNFIGSNDREQDRATEKRCGPTLLGLRFVRSKRVEATDAGRRWTFEYEITAKGRKALAKAEKDYYRWRLARPERLEKLIPPDRRPNVEFFSPF